MKAPILTAACLVALVASASAAPTAEDRAARVAALEARLQGQGYTVLIEGSFVVIGDESPDRVRSHAKFMHFVIALLEQDFFAKQPDKIIEVWLFRNEKTYRRGAKKFFDDEPTTPYGYYSSADDALVMNIGPGAGTLSHELVHPYIEANFPDCPSWFNEGLASLYEQPREHDGHMWGTTNWRLPGLQTMIRDSSIPSLDTLLSTTSEGFYDARFDAYAYARFLCQYLQDHGKLRDFYTTFVADTQDRTGRRALETVLGMKLERFQPIFNKWALSLRR